MVQNFGSFYSMTQGTGVNYEALRKSHFEVDIQGFDTILLASGVVLPKYDLEQVEMYHFNTRTKVAARPNPSDMRIDLMDAVKPDIVAQLWAWFKQIYDPSTDKMGYASDYKREGRVYLYDVTGSLIRTWTCEGLWPRTSPVPEEGYDYSSQELVKIALTLSCDKATLDEIGSGSLI